MPELSALHCEACAPGTPPITEGRAAELHEMIGDEWKREANRSIRREIRLKNFRQAFSLATEIALVSEQEGHHPDLELGWGYLNVTLTTHAAKGLTDNDFIMAAKFNRLLEDTSAAT